MGSLVAVTVCAMLCKVCLGQRDLAAFARNLTREQMKALGFPRDWSKRIHTYLAPSETTFARLLRHLDNQALQRELLRWLDQLLGKRDPTGDQVSVDGKELLNSQGAAVVSAYSVESGRWLGSEPVAEKSNEIPAAQAPAPAGGSGRLPGHGRCDAYPNRDRPHRGAGKRRRLPLHRQRQSEGGGRQRARALPEPLARFFPLSALRRPVN